MMRQLGVALARWLDAYAYGAELSTQPARRVDWIRLVPFLAVHLACFGVIWVGWSWAALAVAAALYFVRMFAITGFYHRYFSHRTFKTSRPMQFLFAVLGSSAAQRGPLWWAAHHRHHHRHSDQPDDVHSPHHHGLWWSHVGWFTTESNFRTHHDRVKDLSRFPELVFLDRVHNLVPCGLAAGLFVLGMLLERHVPQLQTTGPQMLVWGFFISTIVLFHGTCCINSLAHCFGRRRYDTSDHSRNSLILSLITLGEGWHNNHHHYPGATRQGFFWWELDLTYYALWVLARLGVIWDLNPVPEGVRRPSSAAVRP